MKNKKIIIGFIGDHNVGKTVAADFLKSRGFLKLSISSKVSEFAHHLFSEEEIKQNKNVILNEIRRKGYKVHKEYWLNLVMSSIPNDKQYIVFDDLSIDEMEIKTIDVYQILRPNISTIELPNIKTITNEGSIKDFTAKIDNLYRKIIQK